MRNCFVLASVCLAAAGCATDKSTTASIPAYLSAQNGCAVVAGGSLGSDFADPKVEGFWHDVNHQISSSLYEKLAKRDAILTHSVSPINGVLNRFDTWNESTIETRGRELLERALKLWSRG